MAKGLLERISSIERFHGMINLLAFGVSTYLAYGIELQASMDVLTSDTPVEYKLMFGIVPPVMRILGPAMVIDAVIDMFVNEYHYLPKRIYEAIKFRRQTEFYSLPADGFVNEDD